MKKFLVALKVDQSLPKIFQHNCFFCQTVLDDNLQEDNQIFVSYETKSRFCNKKQYKTIKIRIFCLEGSLKNVTGIEYLIISSLSGEMLVFRIQLTVSNTNTLVFETFKTSVGIVSRNSGAITFTSSLL